MEQQANYEKSLPHEVLGKTPNFSSRLAEANEHNNRYIEEHQARMLNEDKEKIAKVKSKRKNRAQSRYSRKES